MTVQELVKNIRTDNELTQQQLADLVHRDQRTVAAYESGKIIPSIDVMLQLSRLFEVDIILGKDITKLLPRYIKAGSVAESTDPEFELKILEASKKFFETTYGCPVEILKDSDHPKAKQAMPGKPAIIVE